MLNCIERRYLLIFYLVYVCLKKLELIINIKQYLGNIFKGNKYFNCKLNYTILRNYDEIEYVVGVL